MDDETMDEDSPRLRLTIRTFLIDIEFADSKDDAMDVDEAEEAMVSFTSYLHDITSDDQ